MASTMFFTMIGQAQSVEFVMRFGRNNVKSDFLNSIISLFLSMFKQDKKQVYMSYCMEITDT